MIEQPYFIELIESLCTYFEENEEHTLLYLPDFIQYFLELKDIKLKDRERAILMEDVYSTGLFRMRFVEGALPGVSNLIFMSDYGIEALQKHITYSGILKNENELKNKKEEAERLKQKKEDKKERSKLISARLQNINYGATVIFGAIGIILAIIAQRQQSNLDSLNNKLQEQSVKMDSILKVLQTVSKSK